MTLSNSMPRAMNSQGISGLELRCLDLISTGASISRTAETLNITEKEVDILLYYVRRRMGAASTMQAIAKCLASGMLPIGNGVQNTL
jgi:DNA-binding CsgD family transcriptional regulator